MIEPRITYWNPSVAAMVAYLDREAIAKAMRKRAKKTLRPLPPHLRHFAQTLKYEMLRDPECHEWNIRKKVVSRLKIGRRMYEKYMLRVRKTLPNALYVGSVQNRNDHPKPKGNRK